MSFWSWRRRRRRTPTHRLLAQACAKDGRRGMAAHLPRDERKIFSIYDANEGHIGEAQMVIEAPLHEAQLFLIIGRKDLWAPPLWLRRNAAVAGRGLLHLQAPQGMGGRTGLHVHALHMCQRLGFLLEGHLRSTHPKDGKWYDSLVMGLLEREYFRRRPKLMEEAKVPSA